MQSVQCKLIAQYFHFKHKWLLTLACKQTFIFKLNGFTALRRCCKVTLVNNASNIDLVLVFGFWSPHQQSGQNQQKWGDMASFQDNRGHVVLTGSFWQGSAAGGTLQRIQTGFPVRHFFWAHFLYLDWKLQPGNARSCTDKLWTSALLECCTVDGHTAVWSLTDKRSLRVKFPHELPSLPTDKGQAVVKHSCSYALWLLTLANINQL